MAGRGGKEKVADDAATPAADDDLIWGINAVREAVAQQAATVSELLVQRGKGGARLQEIIDLAKGRGIAVRFVEPDRMRVARTCRHQGVVARLSAAKLLSFAELLDRIDGAGETPLPAPRLLALDSIQDPRNLGSILRSALAAGFHHVILTRDRSVPVTGTVARTSAGAVAHLSLYQVVNLSDALNKLKERGFWVYGAVAEPRVASIYATDFSGSICLVIGSEGKGLRPLVRQQCDHLVTIPMRTAFDSLNASVAAAVVMFEISRRGL
ncbi:MAG: 23S rRNA (guanosine(2251)-2'-O)-methyltransferase RlmB [Desulfobulbus sp.]|jgi:23S rRNA (guanosine2251-2'-O)-methyltransferase|uniref:23S rRNA (guanosine(2251)-2'-O)-methyltransferase RlmB n=1 Tax=Desulfobulbus sp. TaxID=895 RepID=UPI00283FFCC9|nr:23S rRNA (guanosine(2251)-2'-O)-methyltransferase RlmB [Desulfobulbus sp.]MDR2551536.1 23S rRNA (guanosine(2251)-2'-O)-methyltransferase RlmB [Desulfobulbus sp.]